MLLPSEEEALRRDDFLLGMARQEPQIEVSGEDRWEYAAQAFAELDVALRCQDLVSAEALFREIASRASEGDVLAERPELRAVASRFCAAVAPRVCDQLERALDHQDRAAARRAHQRLAELRGCCVRLGGGRLWTIGDSMGRSAELEARYQQVINHSGPLVCSLFPDVMGLCKSFPCEAWPQRLHTAMLR